MIQRSRFIAAVSCLALCGVAVLAGCGSRNTDEKGDAIKLALLVEKEGESAVAVDDFANGVELAVADINASGGVNGQKVVLTRYPTSSTDPAQAAQMLQKAAAAKPTAIIGLPSTSVLMSALRNIQRIGVPFMNLGYGDLTEDQIKEAGNWIYQAGPSDQHGPNVDDAVKFAVNNLHAKKIGLLYVNLDYGTKARESLLATAKSLGVEMVGDRSYSVTDTDLTQQILAIKAAGADAIINWGYPNQAAIGLQQAKQNGLDVPTIAPAAGELVWLNGLVSKSLMSKFYVSQACNVIGDKPDFAKEYEAKFDSQPGANGSLAYDKVQIMMAAIKDAGSTDPKKITAALDEIDYTGGVCEAQYKSDGPAHVMTTGNVIVDYSGSAPVSVAVK